MLKKVALLAVCFILLYAIGLSVVYDLFNDNLPDIDELETFKPKRVTKVYSAEGRLLRDFHEQNRELLKSYDEIPQSMKDALVAIEDRRFFNHWGIDLRRILGAALSNIQSGNLTKEGASTLTQQLARNLHDKVGRQSGSGSWDTLMASFARKFREQITAVYMERLYTKQEILTMYLNTVFFGHNAWGLKSAARLYFDKTPIELNVEESALIAGLLKAPNSYSPVNNLAKATKRRNLVLREMVSAGSLTSMEFRQLSAKPVEVRPGQQEETVGSAPYFVEYVRQQLYDKYGSSIYRDGLRVHTTLDSRLQQIADRVFETEIGKVQAIVDKGLAAQDTSAGLPDSTTVQAAFIAMDPASGRILAMIGGRDFETSEFNRATQAERQAGSSFKPFVYTAALDNGWFTIDRLEDNAITIEEDDGSIWDPENYTRDFKGLMTLREGFKQSRNLIAIKLAIEISPLNIRDYAQNMGITTSIRPFYAIGIGSSEVKLIDLVAAYSVFPNQGLRVEPTAVDRVIDAAGNLIYESTPSKREVLRPSVAILMTDMMRSVVDEPGGTGYRTLRRRHGFKPQAAGKTGTTNDYADAWFIGFTPHLVAGVWVGMDDRMDDPALSLARLGGASAALPLWAEFMKGVYDEVDYYRDRAGAEFEYPETKVVRLPVCLDTYKLATRYCPRRTEDLFIADKVLPQTCPEHGSGERPRQQRF